MQMKTLLGDKVLVLPDTSDESKTHGGIIIPSGAKVNNNHLKMGVISKKGTGTPWNTMDDVHVKERVCWHKGAGQPHDEGDAHYLILNHIDLFLT